MIEVVSIKFKNRGKCYFFAPNGLTVKTGDKVIVETSKGLEIADCVRGNHSAMDNTVVQPLRPVLRIATKDDLRVEQLNVQREKDAFEICQKKIAEHGLDMKLVDVECNFEGTKTTFFFTSDGRVDFRELVKDLASIFRNRIELRQIGVRDEAKMIGGIGICGRPYCCSQFLDEFQPVSTKMAKVQSLSLNPAKISGSCGRLMCCLRYEQEAYEDLVKKVPKQGSFVETKDGFGTAVQVNLLRQTVKVRLDGDNDELRLYKPNELCAVPGGRPKDGEAPVSTLKYVPEPEPAPEEEEAENPWFVEPQFNDAALAETAPEPETPETAEAPGMPEVKRSSRRRRNKKPHTEGAAEERRPESVPEPAAPQGEGKSARSRRGGRGRSQTVKVEAKAHSAERAKEAAPAKEQAPKKEPAPPKKEASVVHPVKEEGGAKSKNRRRYYHGRPKNKQQ
ncbi:MAG: stage 0 sporulation family protein [Oscillospiraceae bacterium]|nr:stage 0 sporulation family protein [Oscillospiraceae bacterium]